MANNDIQYLQGIDTVTYVRLLAKMRQKNVANLSLTKHHWTLITT